ncbi:hypothetical protein ACQ4LE_009567 [Meloidogyne hapla]|uniref:Myb-like domain-containing protein n=1 Tax=Meloidogyne hapla TaxID=6305 RepID=A0A1I8B9D9_MELHA
MNVLKLVDYSPSSDSGNDEQKTPRATPTPVIFRGKRVFRRIIYSDKRPEATPIKRNSSPEKVPEPPKSPKMCLSATKKSDKKNLNNEMKTPKKKRWTRDESNKLKIALKAAVNPTTDEHWERIAKALGGLRTVSECKEQAIKLDWKPLEENNRKNSADCSDKFFNDNTADIALMDLSLNDSLFDAAFHTPPEQVRCARRPFLLQLVTEEDEGSKESSPFD